jgi:hypothetical protein
MNTARLISYLSDAKLETYPFPYFVSENCITESDLNSIISDLNFLEKSEPTSVFESSFGIKKEWKDFPEKLENLNQLLNFLTGKEFINLLKAKFNIDSKINIYSDLTFDGGGYVVSPPGSYLAYHADFNFSSKAKMYRVLNILLYMNSNYSAENGGELHLLDQESKTVEKRVSPKLGTILGFFTDDTSFHGVSKNKGDFHRRSFNLYYYCEVPISPNQSSDPHKTIWVETKTHDH